MTALAKTIMCLFILLTIATVAPAGADQLRVDEFRADRFRCDCAGAIPLDFWEEARKRLDAVRQAIVLLAEGADPAHQLKAFDVNCSQWAFACQAVVTRGGGQLQEGRAVHESRRHDRRADGEPGVHFRQ